MSLDGKTTRAPQGIRDRIDRILELPPLIEAEGRKLAGLRAERRTQQRKIDAREALLRKELMELGEYQACRNNDERNALFEHSKHIDLEWEGLQERLEQLLSLIDHSTNHREALDHERKALKAALDREYAEIIEQVLHDKALANAVSSRRGGMAA